MNKYLEYLCIGFLCLLSVASCSVKKNTKATRAYHAMTTRFNVYFNGIENFKEQLKVMEDKYEDDYTRERIYMHPVSAYSNPKDVKPGGSFDRTIEKCQKAIQLHSIKKRPLRNSKKMSDPKYREFVTRDEYNPFIHNAWSLMGKAQYYKGDFLGASATFIYITRHFTWKPDLVAESRIWLARCYLEMGWLYEAEDVLQKINNDGLPDSQTTWFATVNADYLIRKGDYKQAIPFLKTAIKAEGNKRQKIRMTYLLAQLYAITGDNNAAYAAYERVIKKGPDYRTELNARIRQTEVFSGKDMEKILKNLTRMTRQAKNAEYLDQIYYAIGNLYLSRKDTAKAVANYILAAEKSTRNGKDKAISQLTLGKIYFDRRDYVKAQPCYAEALPLIDESYPDYSEIAKRSEVLDELVVHAQNVELQDSLQHLASLPEAERMNIIQKIIDDLIAEEKKAEEEARRQAYLEEQEGMMANMPVNNNGAKQPTVPTMNMGNGSNAWYFYNPALVSAGKTEFQRKWGRRKLEDDWRRRNKASFSMSDFADNNINYDEPEEGDIEEISDSIAKGDTISNVMQNPLSSDPKDPQFYVQQLPLTPEDIANSNEIISDGLFNMGLILKNKLEDMSAAISAFNELDHRFPDCEYILETYYNMYLMYMRMGDKETAEVYKKRIIDRFPKSDYAIALADPNYLENLRNMDVMQDSLYNQTYEAYLANNSTKVHEYYELVSRKYPLSDLMPKFMFLNSLSYIGEKNIEAFQTGLKELLEKYPEADVSPVASGMLKGLAQGRTIATDGGSPKGMIWTMSLGGDGDSLSLSNDSVAPFTLDKDVPHSLVLVYETNSISSNQLLFDVAKYNFSNFLIKDFDLEIISFNEISMLIIKGFNNFDELSHYRKMIEGEKGIPLPPGVRPVMISDSNFKLLLDGRSFEDYFNFVQENQ
ncbi:MULTISPECIES: tetratricopeptide repeat protein [Bacteroidales]|uniref:type IX secretion system periplasmic lipoprotein PorW/SprE n=1 Tax=Bacteroidales TaxID=171549 RepID=UPI0005C55690|nr:tetratricopeptide repeat protein [Gabonia massiliensis]